MKKVVCLLLALLLCLGLVAPMMVSAQVHVPSNGLIMKEATVGGEDALAGLVVTSVPEAEEKVTNITQEQRDNLIAAYNELAEETMKLIAQGEPRFLEMLDVRFAADSDSALSEELKKEGVTMSVTFELDVEDHLELVGLTYLDGQWNPVAGITDNKNGTVTVELEEEGPVVFIGVVAAYMDQQPEDKKILVTAAEYEETINEDMRPSVSYKPGSVITGVTTNIDVSEAGIDGDGIEQCIVVTNVAQARQKSTDLSDEERELLIQVYEALESGEMVLPVKDGYVIRDLVDISFKYEGCQMLEAHNNKDANLAEVGVTLTIMFDMGLAPEEEVAVMVYLNGEWVQVEDVENNEDGTLTCVFEDIGPVAFVVAGEKLAASGQSDNPFSGDAMAQTMGLWIGLMVVCAAGVVVLVVAMKRKHK